MLLSDDGLVVDEKATLPKDRVMSEQWHRDYAQLAFRLDKIFHTHIELPYVGYYIGPPEWKARVENESEIEPVSLLRAATVLLDALPEQGFDQHRATYLSKQIGAMETVCRRLNGEQFSFEEELRRLFDISFVWTPEAQFDEALAVYQEALPGKGELADRLHAWHKQHSIPAEKRGSVPELVERMLAEIHDRTLAFIDLPENEGIDLQVDLEMDDGFGGACWYQGNSRSHVEINVDDYIQQQDHVNMLIDTLCHEVYPGHHTAYTLREQHLYREQGYQEEAIGLIFSPAAVIGEGIATAACGMLFSPRELEEWLAEHVYPELGIEPDGANVTEIQRATDLLEGIWGNAFLMMREGQSEETIREYLARYLQQAHLEFWKMPFHEFFGIVEPSGKRLMRPWLQRSDRQQTFLRFLANQWYPSELVK
jgi:hypothetical protein